MARAAVQFLPFTLGTINLPWFAPRMAAASEKGRNASLKVLQKAGFKDISMVTLDGMRHEILNEVDKQKVYDEILAFFDK